MAPRAHARAAYGHRYDGPPGLDLRESGPEIDKTGFGARLRKGDKGLLFLVDAVPGDKVNRPFTLSLKKTWPAGKPSSEW